MNLLEKVQGLNTTIQTVFKEAKKDFKDPLVGVLYDVTPVKSAVANIVAISSVPGMREFKSERKHGVAKNTTATIAPRKWEATLDVRREAIEDDEIGQVPAQTRRMVVNSNRKYGALAIEALNLGFEAKLNDGKAFFHADRKNLVAGALNATTFDKAYDALIGMKDANDEAINPVPTHLIVGVENRAAAEAIVNKENLASGESNPNYKRVELIVDARIKGKTWALVAAGEGVLPLTIAERVKTGALVAKTDLNSDNAFETDVFSWGLRGRFDAAYQDPQFIVAGKGV